MFIHPFRVEAVYSLQDMRRCRDIIIIITSIIIIYSLLWSVSSLFTCI